MYLKFDELLEEGHWIFRFLSCFLHHLSAFFLTHTFRLNKNVNKKLIWQTGTQITSYLSFVIVICKPGCQ